MGKHLTWLLVIFAVSASFADESLPLIASPGWMSHCAEQIEQARTLAETRNPLFRELSHAVVPTGERDDQLNSEPRVGVYLEVHHDSPEARHYSGVITDHHRGMFRFYADVVYSPSPPQPPRPEEKEWLDKSEGPADRTFYRSHGPLYGRLVIFFYRRKPDRPAIRLFQELFKPAIESCLGLPPPNAR